MQIWRAHADGSDPEQVTQRSGLARLVPAFLARRQVDRVHLVRHSTSRLSDHPPNRDVTLRIMPADGSAPPRVLTRLFGGQGTINVPSWSPDGKSIAFVSYRLVR